MQAKTTSTEFLEWMAYLNLELERTTKQDYLFASIAVEVRKSRAKDADKIKIEDVLVKMKAGVPVEQDEEDEDEDAEEENEERKLKEYTAMSKATWFGLAGVDMEVT